MPAGSASKPRGSGGTGKRPLGSNGQGAGSALVEMLKRRAQNPRPGGVQQQPRNDIVEQREPRPAAPRKPRG